MAPRWTWVFLVVYCASRVLTVTGETCSYSDEMEKKGPQNLWTGFRIATDLDDCKSFCGSQSGCVAGEFQSVSYSCYLYSVVPTLSDDTPTTFFQRTCVPDTTTAATTVTTTSNPTTVATLGSTATTTTATIVTSTTPTSTTHTTSSFSDTTTAATTVTTTTSNPTTVATLGSTATMTTATIVTSTTTTPTSTTHTSSFSDTTTTTLAPTTTPATTPTITSTTSPGSCKMTRSPGTTGVSSYYKLPLRDVDSCNSICVYLRACRATTYRLSICTLYPGTSIAASGNIVDFVRHTCYNGTFCCMSSSLTQRASGSPLLSVSTAASLAGCEAICLAVVDCQGTYYSGESCFFYTTTATTFGGTIIFSRKTCSGDQTNRGNLAFDSTCKERPKRTYTRYQQLSFFWYYPWQYYRVPDYTYFWDPFLVLFLLEELL